MKEKKINADDFPEERQKKLIRLFTSSEERRIIDYDLLNEVAQKGEKNDKLAYLGISDKSYSYIIAYICLLTLYSNLRDHDKNVAVEDLKVGARVIYNNKYYIYKGKSEKFDDFFVLEESNRKKNKVTTEIGKANFKNIMIADINKQRSLKNYRQKIAKKLNVENPSMNNKHKILILINKNQALDLLKRKIKIDQGIGIGTIFSGGYLNGSGEIETMSGLGHAESSYIVFSSDLFTANEYLMNNSTMKFKAVYVFGNLFVSDGNIGDFSVLLELCKEKKVGFNFFGDFHSFLNENFINKIRSFDNIIYNVKKPGECEQDIIFEKINVPTEIQSNVAELNNFLIVFEDNGQKLLQGMLLKFKQLLFSGATSERLERLSELIFEKLNRSSLLVETQLSETFEKLVKFNGFELICDRIHSYVNGFQNILIVVHKDNLATFRQKFKNLAFIHFASYGQKVSESYSEATTMLLVSPNKKQRRKWLYTSIYKKGVVLSFSPNEKFQNISLKNDVRILGKIKGFEGVSEIWQLPYVTKHLKLAKQNNLSLIDDKKNVDQINEIDDLMAEEIGLKVDQLVQNKIDNGTVDVVVVIKLSNNGIIYGTEFGEVLIIKNDTLRKKRIKKLNPGDVVFESRMPYSDVAYRKHFSECYYDADKPENKDEQLDFYWKSSLIKYLAKNDISVYKMKELFAEQKYKKSIGFFQSWSKIKRMPMLPHDIEFISTVGKIVKDPDIEENPNKYYQSSKRVKEAFSSKRDEYLNSLDNSLVAAIEESMDNEARKEKVILSSRQKISNFSRDKTNKLIWGEFNG
ncbi:hypothetical protein LFYK43_06340 [Ligilactobacillus salitolerans]|uniref:Uncharacterized protein n=1 Tax=Ligilactobacillus salitolerans TaxID=1808352 RepID=A0A401IRP6_9LACO|nr:hypothetical protein [Ligilactobacillus salitolerans]GBG94175.1 hypothetical protein LFYK43_06340 [Ligilactobacillus salitolerans]